MTKLILTVALLLASTAHAYEFPLVMLKSGGDYNARNYITEDVAECTRIINFDNVSMLRTFEMRELLIDGHINIVFRTPEERGEFLDRYRSYITKPVAVKHWWEF